MWCCFFFQAEDGIRYLVRSRGLGDVYKRQPYEGRSWLDLPWYFAETYFYRRLLEAVGYFQPGPWQGHDPYAAQKREEEGQAAAWLASSGHELAGGADLTTLLHSSLWGNRADPSRPDVQEEVQGLSLIHISEPTRPY